MTIDSGMGSNTTSFRKKVLNSAKLSTIRFASDVVLRLVSTVVLTRLLAPEVYGVFAIVLVYLYLLEMVSDIGLRSLILTREGQVSDSFLRTCWTVSVVRGLVILLSSIVIAGVIFGLQGQSVFAEDSPYSAATLPWAIAGLGGTHFLLGFQSLRPAMRERAMDFGRVTFVHVATNIVGLVATIALAYYLRSVWALVLGNAAKSVVYVALSFLAFKGPRLHLQLNREDLSVVIDRGKWIMGQSVLYALSQSADRLVLGFVMTSSTFGLYFVARQIVDLVSRFMTSLDGQMAVQVFTHLHKSTTENFRRNYYRYRLFFDAIAGLSVGGMLVLAPLAVQIVFDDRYQGVAPIIQALIWSVLLIGPTLLRNAFIAERRFKEMTLLSVATTIMLWVGLMIAIFIFESVPIALTVIALQRLPEAMILTVMGGDRGWVVVWREFISFGFCVIGALAGWALLALVNMFL
jgi:O-antigen/teichoic acid export membrane protein